MNAVVPRTTEVYKTIEGCAIQADVFGAEPGGRKPAVLWIHGGGLIFGTRTTPRPTLLAALLQAGAVVVSIDHRLAPETPLPGIADDMLDAWRWLHEEGPARWGVDPQRTAVAGASAGAYLSLIAGYRATPAPRAVLSMWGFGDITAPWEAEPSAHYLKTLPLITREQALATVGRVAIAEQLPTVDRGYFYVYCRQQGRWPQEVAGHDPRTEPHWFDAWCPVRQIGANFPPTMLVHGEDDQDVPCEQSRLLAARLAQAGVAHELLVLPGAGHGLSGISAERVAATEGRAAAFLMDRLA